MTFNDLLKLDLPDAFPAAQYSEFMTAARAVLLPNVTNAWKEFAGASNLIGWRFRSCYEDMGTYVASWKAKGDNASFEELYLRERALFNMFVSGVSCIESTCYASYALSSHPAVLGLPFEEVEQRFCSPSQLCNALTPHKSGQVLVSVLSVILDSDEWRLWVDFRNRMAHRSNLPRIIYCAIGSPAPPAEALQFAATSSTQAFEADVDDLKAHFSWLSNSLGELLTGAHSLINNT